MRAIGKGSLASLLAAFLNIARIIIWIAFAGLAVAVVIIPVGALVFGWLQGVESLNIDGEFHIGRDDYTEVAYQFVTFAVLLFVVSRLLEILKTLRFGSPFVRENAERFRNVGYALLIGEGAKFVFGILSMIFDADIDIDIELITWIAIIAVFVLAEVFHEGARMKEEQDLTV
jgi:NADH:ubiquinone oxidoreductase subunit 6 (subunit J)